MNPDSRGMTGWIKAAYDKLVLFMVLFVLLVSAILLAFFVDREKKELTAARWNRPDVPPKNSKPVDITALHEAIDSLSDPFQMGYGSNRMMVAELRVACVKCARPIPYAADVCPYKNCGVRQPTSQDNIPKDSDMDRMPDEWEKKYGLNPTVDDSQKDADGDQFTNWEEYQYGTHPKDSRHCPPPVCKLRWIRIGRTTLPFSFQSVQHPVQGERIFVLKNKKIQRDYYVKIGDKVEGYEVVEYEPKTTNVTPRGVRTPIPEDVSILKLRKDDKIIALTRGQDVQGEMAAELVFLVDKSKYRVKANDVIPLKNNRYKIVDILKDTVVVSDNSTGIKTSLEKYSEADRLNAPENESGDK